MQVVHYPWYAESLAGSAPASLTWARYSALQTFHLLHSTGGAVPLECRQHCGRRAERAHLSALLRLPVTVPGRRGVGDVAAGGSAAAIALGVAATPLELRLRLQLLPHGELFSPEGGGGGGGGPTPPPN